MYLYDLEDFVKKTLSSPNPAYSTGRKLALSGRPMPPVNIYPWQFTAPFLDNGSWSPITKRNYLASLRFLADWLYVQKVPEFKGDEWELDPHKLTQRILADYAAWLSAHRARATLQAYWAALISYLNYLEWIQAFPPNLNMAHIRQLLARQTSGTYGDSGDIEGRVEDIEFAIPKIAEYYNNLPLPPASNEAGQRYRLIILRNRAAVNLLWSTALRVSELHKLTRQIVQHGRATKVRIVGKRNKPRTVQIRPYAQEAITAYLRERVDLSPHLFICHSRSRAEARLSVRGLQRVISHACRALGLDETQRVSVHDFRHFRAIQLLKAGVPLEVVQEYLGHEDISTTRNIYAPVLGEDFVAKFLAEKDIPPPSKANLSMPLMGETVTNLS